MTDKHAMDPYANDFSALHFQIKTFHILIYSSSSRAYITGPVKRKFLITLSSQALFYICNHLKEFKYVHMTFEDDVLRDFRYFSIKNPIFENPIILPEKYSNPTKARGWLFYADRCIAYFFNQMSSRKFSIYLINSIYSESKYSIIKINCDLL